VAGAASVAGAAFVAGASSAGAPQAASATLNATTRNIDVRKILDISLFLLLYFDYELDGINPLLRSMEGQVNILLNLLINFPLRDCSNIGKLLLVIQKVGRSHRIWAKFDGYVHDLQPVVAKYLPKVGENHI
jgi:hypothetical protein